MEVFRENELFGWNIYAKETSNHLMTFIILNINCFVDY